MYYRGALREGLEREEIGRTYKEKKGCLKSTHL